MTAPVDYRRLCRQTVTLYHKAEDGSVQRTILRNVFFDRNRGRRLDKTGEQAETGFLLVLPCKAPTLKAGDKLMEGEGPKLSAWTQLLPAVTDGVFTIREVGSFYWQGALIHEEGKG